jgi:2-desacetyl-2-hydroxyethyl bacteriochlorophyllide A dehydrogenase
LKAVVIHGPHDLRIDEVPDPVPGAGEVVCRVAAAGICGTDTEILEGTMAYLHMGMLNYPWTPGHEWSGVVETLGDGVTSLKAGDRVTGECSIPCGTCVACRRGDYHLCDPRTEVGLTGRFPGAFAERIRIPASGCFKVPAAVSLREAAMTEPSGVSVHAVDLVNVRPGEKVLVLGDGTIGQLAAQVAKAAGAAPVVMLGSREHRMKMARKVGIEHVVNRHDSHAPGQILAALGGKADHVIEATGNPKVMDTIPELVRMGGHVVVVSFFPSNEITFNFNNYIANEIQIFTMIAGVNRFARVLSMMGSKLLNVLPLQSEYYTLDEAKKAFEDTANRKTSGVKTLVVNRDVLD